ncbi:H-NS histone family protein [Luteimonas sp. BDR2-5]|uniref:H-NS histone family protein n=1 Tax=Proluteimonas luteida TaxID=2878685 RepID=UPI001E5DD779|nr:H-NS histone family protein [Luteimonas sp. BDR2-5]MCD9027326.1 H-NS histone family protein [Luteimonas sp. BDR2-5]
MAFDLNAFSPRELESLIAQAKQRKTALKKRKPIASVRKKVTDLAASEGYSIAELFGGSAGTAKTATARKTASPTKGRKLGKVPPKYRNPANKAETWTGRGKQPLWLAAQIKKGKKLEEFLIK